MGSVARRLVILLAVPACSFEGASNMPLPMGDAGSGSAIDATPIDAAPITCGALTCDPNAICDDSGATATCHCPAGFDDPAGNGFSCHDIDECALGGRCDSEMACQNTPGSYVCYTPKTCKEAHDHGQPPGDTKLYFDGVHDQRWTAFCDVNDDYLTLPQGSGKNYAQYTHVIGGTTDRRTTYLRVRIDPATLVIDTKNSKYTSSSGNTPYAIGIPLDKISYGVAISCADQATGSANVDLSGTPFRVKHDETSPWSLGGSNATGTAVASNNDQTWNITGAGRCGWSAPAPAPSNQPPVNGSSGSSKLQLEYITSAQQ